SAIVFTTAASASGQLLFRLFADAAGNSRLADFSGRLVCLLDALYQRLLQRELLFQVAGADLYARIHPESERLRVALTLHSESDLIGAGQSLWSFRLYRHAAAEHGGHAVSTIGDVRRRITHVPNKAVRTGRGCKRFRGTEPVGRERRRRGRRQRFVGAGIGAHHLAPAIQDFKSYFTLRRRPQVIVEGSSERRILARRYFRSERRVVVGASADTHGRRRFEKIGTSRSNVAADLTQRRDVIQNPERPPMRRCNQIIVFNHQIVHRGRRHVKQQRLPVVAIVKGEVNSQLSSGE